MSWSFRTNGNFIDFVHTYENDYETFEDTIVSLHNTSKCVDWSLPEDETRISFTIDEVKYSNVLITDIDFDGTAMNSQDDFETGIEAMFPGLAGGEGGSSYLVYTAYLSQTGTDAPVADVLENTLGGTVVWARDGVGQYKGTLAGAFTTGKTVIPGFNYPTGNLMGFIYSSTPADHYYSWSINADTNRVQLFVATNPGDVFAEFSTAFGSSKLFVEIRVYP